MPRHIRIFLSSPGDVADERKIALEVIDQLPDKPAFRDKVTIRVVAWDKPGAGTPMLATMSPQAAIDSGLPKPSECDVVVVIFWARMGTPLDYKGKSYQSGTHYEYEEAIESARQNKRPEVVVYRRTEEPVIGMGDVDFIKRYEQYQRVQEFFAGFIGEEGKILQGYNQYEKPEDFRREFENHLETLVLRLLEKPFAVDAAGDAPTAVTKTWPGSPFPGLRAFTEEQAPIYFGRGRETDALIKKVAETRFVAVIGASGSGKSSLVAAGLIPRLRDNAISGENVGSKDWHITRFTPGEKPFESLAGALIRNVPSLKGDPVEYAERVEKLAGALRKSPESLAETLETALADEESWAEVLLFVDQFEELFTVADPAQRKPFAEMLAHASDRMRVIVTLRADFYHQAVPYLAEQLRDGDFALGAPSPIALYEMTTRPAERAGLTFDGGLAEQIIDDTGDEPGALALMAYALDELYKIAEKRGDRCLTFDDYDELNSVQGAIGKRAESVFSDLPINEPEEVLRRVFRELVEVDERGTATRQRVGIELFERDDAATQLLMAFTEARLLVQSRGGDSAIVEVSHEALFRSWKRLADWIEEAQADLFLLRQMRNAAAQWEESRHSRSFLWLTERGQDMMDMLERQQPKLNEVEKAFARPEQAHLLDEIADVDILHQRREVIGLRLYELGDPRPDIGLRKDGLPHIEWCYVDVPEHLRGKKIEFIGDEGKYGDFEVQPFYIAKYLVTYPQFQVFLDDPEGFENDKWWEGLTEQYRKQEMSEQRQKYDNYPRGTVSWYQCVAFTRWLNAKLTPDGWPVGTRYIASAEGKHQSGTQWQIRLPTEWEWQQAATGGNPQNEYPWGEWDGRRCNTAEAGIGRTTAVGMYPAGAARCGALDMSGNLREWCLNEYEKPANVGISSAARRVLRGGAFNRLQNLASCAYRNFNLPYSRHYYYGFRVVCVAAP